MAEWHGEGEPCAENENAEELLKMLLLKMFRGEITRSASLPEICCLLWASLGFFDNPLVLPLPCWSLAFQGFVPLKMFGWLIWKIGKSGYIGEIGISWNWSYSTAMAMGPYGRDGVKKKRQIKWRWLVNSKMDTYKDISQTHGSLSSRPLCSGTMSSPPNQPRHQPSENQSLWFGDKYLSSDYLVTTSLARVCTGALGRGGSP